ADGTLDATFAGGTTTMPIGQEADAMTIGPDGTIVAAGPACFQASDGTLDCSFALVRYRDCPCSACETCDAAGACVAAPRPSCQVSTRPQRAQLAMRVGSGGAARM